MGIDRRHLRKDCANTTLPQQDIDWDESDREEGEENGDSSTSAKSTDTTAGTPPTTQDHQQLTSRYGSIIKSTRRYIEQADDKC